MAARPELGAEKKLRELVHQEYNEMQRDMAKARTESERLEKEYGDVPLRSRADEPATSALLSDSDAASVQTGQSEKQIITKLQPRREDFTSPEKITEYYDLSMRELADLITDETFQINSKNNSELPHREKKNNAHATRNKRVRLNQEHEFIPASVLQRQAVAGPRQGTPGLQKSVGVQTGIACQKAETVGPAIGFSRKRGVAQVELAPRRQAMARVQPGRPTLQTVCAHVREDSSLSVSHHRTALRNQMRTNANGLLPRSHREGTTPAGSVFLPPRYPGMIQISGEDICGTGVQATRAPADPQEIRLPNHEIPEATGTPLETPQAEAEPSSRETTSDGRTQQPSDHLVEPEPSDDGAVPILTARKRSTTRICINPESSTSTTRISTEKEINVPGSGLRVTVSHTKQRLEMTDARGLHMAHDEDETVVRKVLVPGGRVGAPPLPRRDGGRSHLKPAHVDEKPFIGRRARVVSLERRQTPGEVKEGAARAEPQEQAALPCRKPVRHVMNQAPCSASLKRGQEFVPRPPVMVVRDDARERVLGRTQVDRESEELEAVYTHLKKCNSCSRYLNPLLRKMGVNLAKLPCANNNGPQFKCVAGEESATESEWTEDGRADANTLSTSASCKLLCWDVEGLSKDAVVVPAVVEPLVTQPRDDKCSPICWKMLTPTTDKVPGPSNLSNENCRVNVG